MPIRWRMSLAVVLIPVAVIAASSVASTAASTPTAAPTGSQTPNTTSTAAATSRSAAAGWKWSKTYKLAGSARKKGIGGISCPTVHLCVADASGANGIYYTTDAAGAATKWHFRKFSEPFAGADGGDDVSCTLDEGVTNCAMVGWQPVGGVFGDSYGGSIFQSGQPTKANWGAALISTETNGDLGAVSCWVNVQCASLDDAGSVVSTQGATVTSGPTPLWPQDTGFSGIWAINCARGIHPNPFCAAVDQNSAHTIAWSTDPADGKWHIAAVPVPRADQLWHIACGGAGVCVVAENNDTGSGHARIAVSRGDTARKSWAKSFKAFDLFPKDSGAGVSAVTCEAAKLCFAAGESAKHSFVSVSSNPAAPGSWHTYPIKGHMAAYSMSCPTSKVCVLMSGNGEFVVGKRK
jgi:hypothetical protein